MKTQHLIIRITTVCLLLAGLSTQAQKLKKNQYPTPLIEQRADPFVTRAADGTYYFIATVPEYDRIEIRKAPSIAALAQAPAVVVWRKHTSGPMGNHIWAPEMHRIDGKWYIYFAAGSAEDKWAIRMYALSNSSEDPTTGQWVEEGQVKSHRDEFALDATTFEVNGQRYMIWADRASSTVVNTGLYIAHMTSPTTLGDKQVVITQPEYDWEIKKYRVNEGPAVLVRNDKVFLTFSASATDANYCMGMMWANADADLLDPAAWHKLDKPVFYTNESLKRFGPGHNSFTVAEDGKTDVMIYHARDYKDITGDSLYDPNRHTRARVVKWNADGTPNFGQELNDQEMGLKKAPKKKKK
ncbi:MAG: glycoside hydrolase family 43 protein [Marinilabiliaceae bacterium]|nr:glycoside hydrolase family 43 protein [Marinilabiliaceae bacterium]